MSRTDAGSGNVFQRLILPGLAFKAVVVGGGYATGRELVEFFMGAGPSGGLYGMLISMALWSVVCAIAFAMAQRFAAYDYRTLFKMLLGPGWVVFEVMYLLFLILILAVMSAAAGEIGAAVFDFPLILGSGLLLLLIAGVTSFGNDLAERMFKVTSSLLYLVYAFFLIFAIMAFGDLIPPQFEAPPVGDWVTGGFTYASYNVVAAVAVLPFVRHMRGTRDAVVAGMLAGPMAMLPAIIFFVCMTAYYPQILDIAVPSDFLIQRLNMPWFAICFQLMIFIALLETGVGAVNALHERISEAVKLRGHAYGPGKRFLVGIVLLAGSGYFAVSVGLIDLIASGYVAFGYIMLAILVLPVVTVGLWRLLKDRRGTAHAA
ncbi:YkvI family membrane protein [Pacificimonas sp. ICDLI1SI03]